MTPMARNSQPTGLRGRRAATSPPSAAYASMPNEIDTSGQKRAGPPTRPGGTRANRPMPTAHETLARATKDQANQPAARGLIGSPVGAIVSPGGDAGNGSPWSRLPSPARAPDTLPPLRDWRWRDP